MFIFGVEDWLLYSVNVCIDTHLLYCIVCIVLCVLTPSIGVNMDVLHLLVENHTDPHSWVC